MSVYRPKGTSGGAKSPFYQYDFQVDGNRFFGTTKATSRRDAEAIEKELKKKAKADLAEQRKSGNGPLTYDAAAGRYWTEVGQYHANSDATWTNLGRLVEYFGKTKRLDETTDADIAALVAWRRAQTRWGKKEDAAGNPMGMIAAATVNRSTVDLLKKIFNRAKRVWRYSFPLEPIWKDHRLDEPKERVRELDADEGEALEEAVRDDYALWLEFARLSGLRHKETLIRWPNVNWFAKKITTIGKGGREVSTPITDDIRAILEECKGQHPEFVFTYVARKTRTDKKTGTSWVKGQRYPITYQGSKTQWRRLRAKAKVEDFRFHDIRHDVGTKLLRATGNLKVVQKALNHASITTTVKYAHVMQDEVADGLALVAKSRRDGKSRKKSRNDVKGVA
ncbi:conserved hypothetical protein [uncultured Pleomorphomonas sp.]|uniref:Tyr recombinase domain-containing protein n=1 Tax=uncultured Pleomorphomonas sp. TaxID=442121 RepID=A0A212L7P7_9HYPH|nr:tyrosine-type recombinase/integrase [uncultured Pleomorphomonas sp.]SCM73497.1 conserved hypothetical protein [uncultured Pleomorphomonas sp.]